jgi:hypothetical protein
MPPRRRGDVRPAGQIRQSQMVTSFGPGAMVDLPDYAVIIGGLDHWTGHLESQISEERLAGKVKALLRRESVRFYAPPRDKDDPTSPITGVTAWLFPEWFVAQFEVREGGIRSRPLVYRTDLQNGMYRRERERPVKVVPIRFVQACPRGHVSDIDWKLFVHGPENKCSRPLWIEERGTSGDLTDVIIRCECGLSKALSAATKLNDVPLGFCKGRRPWLGPNAAERCGGDEGAHPNRLLIRAASNAYFAQTLSVISIPESDAAVREAVDEVYEDFLSSAESIEDVTRERKKKKVSAALERVTDEQVWREIQRRRGAVQPAAAGIREAEITTLLSSPESYGDDQPDGVFFARTISVPSGEPALTSKLSRVVKVHRLREVIAQVGFTRFEAAVPDVNGELALDVERAELSLDQDWLPAVENRGEGVFVGLDDQAIQRWMKRPEVRQRASQLAAGFQQWKKANQAGSATSPGAPFIMLHSLSHLLITAVALECGYASSSIRERIYASDAGYGILLYTASPDAEGTLGGLVEAADRIDRYLRQAVELGQLCANDPVCAQHRPDSWQEDRFLHGAACHGCLLLAESSCERRNDFLDRALVVPTVDGGGAAFFDEA